MSGCELRRRAHDLFGLRTPQCGAVTFVQRYGDALNCNPHFHCLALDGVYAGGGDGVATCSSHFERRPFDGNDMMLHVTGEKMKSTVDRVRKHRQELRAAGLRPIQIWVPDSRRPGFAQECRRQSRKLRGDPNEKKVLQWLRKIAIAEDWK
jgi:hypothetical protein